MAFPVVEATNNWTSGTTSSSSHNVSLPSGIQAGDLIILSVTSGATATTLSFSTPTGWDLVATRGTANNPLTIFSRVSDGTEGGSVTVTLSNSGRVTSNSYRISNASGNVEGSVVSSNSSNPPSVTASWGSDDNLWIALYSSRWSGTSAGAPTHYDNLIESKTTESSSTNNADNQNYSARRELATETENPGSFSSAGNENSPSAGTIVIEPSDAPTNTGNFLAFM